MKMGIGLSDGLYRKGEMIRGHSKEEIQRIETRINSMYRKSLGWKTANMCFEEEIEQLLLSTG